MLFRGTTPIKMRQPKSAQLASLLQLHEFTEGAFRRTHTHSSHMSRPILPRYRRHPFLTEDGLRGPLRPPPGIYEWTSAERFGELMATGHFNVVIIFLWFWYDPQPSAAELMLPLIRAHAPADRQPFVGLLSDDAHAARAQLLGEVETNPSTREGYKDRARNYWVRQKNMYRLVDMVMYISPMDQVNEARDVSFRPMLFDPCFSTHAFRPMLLDPCFSTHAFRPMLFDPCFSTRAFPLVCHTLIFRIYHPEILPEILLHFVCALTPHQVSEKESFPFVHYFRLARMPIRAFRILSKSNFVTISQVGRERYTCLTPWIPTCDTM